MGTHQIEGCVRRPPCVASEDAASAAKVAFIAAVFALVACGMETSGPTYAGTAEAAGGDALEVTPNGYIMTVDPGAKAVVWEGWGSALSWWAKAVGGSRNADVYADLLYTLKDVEVGGGRYPGLGLNVLRYNLGGGGSGGPLQNPSTAQAWFRDLTSYWVDWESSDPSSASWNFWLDSNQRNMAWKARDRGANIVELFSSSPPWWMNRNRSSAGSDDGADNLTAWNQDNFAHYLATVAHVMRGTWGLNVISVEPFNEPSAGWWRFPGHQEGCHFDVSTQNVIIARLSDALTRHGLSWLPIAASDENSPDEALRTWTSHGEATRALIGKVNVHSYDGQEPYRGDGRRALREAIGPLKRLWVSEYGDNDASGLELAVTITEDLNGLRPSAWNYWQPVEPDTSVPAWNAWGLINAQYVDTGDQPSTEETRFVRVNRKFWVLGQFTRHIRPGMQILESEDPNTVIAFDGQSRVVIATVNSKEGRWVRYYLSAFAAIPPTFTRIATTTEPGGSVPDWRQHTDVWPVNDPAGKSFWAYFPARSVQTFVLDGVRRTRR